MRYFDEHLPGRLLSSLLFATAFTVLGYYVPNIYFRYIDRTEYFTISQPISLDKKFYQPCEQVRATINRKALLDTTGHSVVDLMLIRTDDLTEKVVSYQRDMAITKGDKILIVSWGLPCDLANGTYFFKAVSQFEIRGVQKNYAYYSKTFNVDTSGTDPKVQDQIDDSK